MGCGGGSSNAGDQLRAQQQQQQALTDQSVGKINQAFAGFTPSFYQGISNAYTNWAEPQLQQQYQQTQNQLGFKLANQGLGGKGTSQKQDMFNQLGQAQTQSQQQIAQQANQQSQNLQQQVAQEQAQLMGQAQTATDPSAVGQAATAAASGFSAPSSFQPLGQMFGNFSNLYLGNQSQNTYSPAILSLLGLGYGGSGNQWGGGSAGSFSPLGGY